MSQKAIISADLHLHKHKDRVDRLQHCIDALDWIFRTAEETGCTHIFFLGDLFHERDRIDILNYLRTFETIVAWMKNPGLKLYLLVGNHDMYHRERWGVNSVKPLNVIQGVHIIEQPCRTEIGGLRIDWMPHTDNPVKALAALKEKNGGPGDLLLGHMAVHGAYLNTCYGTKADVIVEYDNEMVPVDAAVFAGWKRVLLGHYHGAQQVATNAEYVGSPLELTFGEAFQQKRLVVLDLETLEREYVVNDFSPKHILASPEQILHGAYDLNGNFVRLLTRQIGSREEVDLRRKISEEYRVLTLDVKQVERQADEDRTIVEDARSVLHDTREMLKFYVKQKGTPNGLSEERLLTWGEECLEAKI